MPKKIDSAANLRAALEALNEKYYEHFDLWRNGDYAYSDERMLTILKGYKQEYLEICSKDLPR